MLLFLQILLSIVIVVLSFLLSFAAIQVFHILHEFRLTLKKVNKILDHTETLSTASAKPVAAVNNFFTEVNSLVRQTQNEIISATPDRVISPGSQLNSSANQPPGQTETLSRRFFRRSGLPLRSS